MRNRKEGRKKRTREIQRKRSEKGGGQKRAQEKQTETQKNEQKCPFLGRTKKTGCSSRSKERKAEKKHKKNKNKEGLGPSVVALWATSPDP